MTRKWYKEGFRGAGKVLFLDLSSGSTSGSSDNSHKS